MESTGTGVCATAETVIIIPHMIIHFLIVS
jgi:hypothetical protein